MNRVIHAERPATLTIDDLKVGDCFRFTQSTGSYGSTFMVVSQHDGNNFTVLASQDSTVVVVNLEDGDTGFAHRASPVVKLKVTINCTEE